MTGTPPGADAPATAGQEGTAGPGEGAGAFHVHLDNFDGPFDLLLGLIAKHKLDITEVALAQVTDEFLAHISARGRDWDLDQATSFLLVAATLLDLKAARLLPQGDVEDEEDLALLEARDLLFARLLQYRAYKEAAAVLAARMAAEAKRFPRVVGLEERFAAAVPEVLLTVTPQDLAAMAARALAPKSEPVVSIAHVHAPAVSVREQAALLVDRLRRQRAASFRQLTSDCVDRTHVVARFLALLELYREQAVAFEQLTPLGDLTVRWTGADEGDVAVEDEFDEPAEPMAGPDADGGPDVDLTALGAATRTVDLTEEER